MKGTGEIVKKDDLQLEYFTYGSGNETVVCMHGHGRSAHDFDFIASEKRRVISIHLFFHGESLFPEERIEKQPLKTNEFIELFKLILLQEKIERFHLLAFSQGGRFSLVTLPFFSKEILTFTLIAPDGMDNNSFYNWTSRQKWARRIFKGFEGDPSRLITMSNIATKVKLMRPKVKTFVHEFASDKHAFKRASSTWRAFREVLPDNFAISKAIKENKIPFRIIMGTHDQVIRPKQAYAFVEKLGLKKTVVVEIDNGHNFFKKSSISKFKDLILGMRDDG